MIFCQSYSVHTKSATKLLLFFDIHKRARNFCENLLFRSEIFGVITHSKSRKRPAMDWLFMQVKRAEENKGNLRVKSEASAVHYLHICIKGMYDFKDFGYLFPFALLCVWQSIWQLVMSVAPPLDQAVTWSASISENL